jgi:hypothetical protein
MEDVTDEGVAAARSAIEAILDGTAAPTALRDLRDARGRMPGLPGRLEKELRGVDARVHDLDGTPADVRERALKIVLVLEPAWLQETLARVVAEPRHGPKLRRLAASASARRPGHERLLELVREGDEETRLLVILALGAVRAADAAPALVDALEADSLEIRRQAILALFAITGKQLDYDPEAPPEKRAESVQKWRAHLAK